MLYALPHFVIDVGKQSRWSLIHFKKRYFFAISWVIAFMQTLNLRVAAESKTLFPPFL